MSNMTLEEETRSWSRRKLRNTLLYVSDCNKEFEAFLISKLGEQKYLDLCKDFAIEHSVKFLRKNGVDDDGIQEFLEEMKTERELKS